MIFIGYLSYVYCTSYIGIFDVGSTGTRLHLYEYNGNRITGLNSYNNYPGIGTIEDDKIIQSLIKDLVNKAMGDYKTLKSIPLGVYCTAGLREIEKKKANHKLKVIASTLKDFNLIEIKILSGEEEGYLAFISLLYIIENSKTLNNLERERILYKKDNTKVVLESIPLKSTLSSTLHKKFSMDDKNIIFDDSTEDRLDKKNLLFLIKDDYSDNIGLLDMGGMSVQVTYNKGKKIFTRSLEIGFKELDQLSLSKTKVKGLFERKNSTLIYKKNINRKISGVEKIPELSLLKKIYLSSFFTDTLKKYVNDSSITLKNILDFYRNFCEYKAVELDFQNYEDCKDIFLILGFLVKIGVNEEQMLYLVKDLSGIRFNWTIAKSYFTLKDYLRNK